jgi:transposase InsO family protein
LFGISRQGYNKHSDKLKKNIIEENLIVNKVQELRKDHPKMGGKKLYYLIKPEIKKAAMNIGRDKFFKILAINNLLIKNHRKQIRTTYSFHWLRKYKNLIKDKTAERKNEIWVSDLTYWNIGKRFLYLHFITDVYSKKIVGYSVSETMKVNDIMPSLEMALSKRKNIGNSLIHHSDRGIQYCSKLYTEMLKSYNIEISMTEKGDPLENPLAERINGIMKEEYLKNIKIENITKARKELSRAVELYNNNRPHLSCNYHTPNEVYEGEKVPKIVWKNYYKNTTVNLFQDNEKVVNLC